MARKKASTVLGASAFAALVALSACGQSNAVPMDDEYAGNSGESSTHSSTQNNQQTTDPNTTTSTKKDSGNYQDGTYAIKAQYGPVGEDNIDVTFTISNQDIAKVEVVGHPSSSISKKHQNAFISEISGTVVGKPLKDLKIDVVAGASWTSDAFNKALNVVRQVSSVE
ncbi:MAG: FMN-binding protein [Bifidobacteriaceae bacterium]|nr:FMN-binding protein [Bifidobacteriaceae bacterium]